jgi:hypothetical protein
MHDRPLRRAAILAAAGVLAFAGLTSADQASGDGDLTTSADTTVDLVMAPGETRTVDVGFVLRCTGFNHLDPGQVATYHFSGGLEPFPGAIGTVSEGTLGPVPTGWPAEGDACDVPAQVMTVSSPSHVVLHAPAVVGDDYEYVLMWAGVVNTPGTFDSQSLRGAPAVTFHVDVVSNTPPVLTVPADFQVEGDTTGGWTAAFDVSATDADDDPDPDPSCTPAVGDVLGLGTTTVSCTVVDGGKLSVTDTFDVTVVDSTAPALTVPGDQSVTTSDPNGAAVEYGSVSATDIVDSTPTVGCSKASGSVFPVGTTTVTCTATDDSQNTATGTFHVTVDVVPAHSATAAWGEPVAGSGLTFSANRGRTIPVKVTLAVDGVARTSGDASLRLSPCGSSTVETSQALSYSGGRWNASLDTSRLGGSCYQVTARIDGLDAGSFRLELRGAEATSAKPKK